MSAAQDLHDAEARLRARLGARFERGQHYLDGGLDVRTLEPYSLETLRVRAWDANQIDDLRKIELEIARRAAGLVR